MTSKRAERIVIISGKDGYVGVTPAEQKAFRIEVFFTATNVGLTNYYSYEWYKKKSLYGRIKIVRGEYTTKEKLVQYQNELVYSEEATLFEIVKRLQCQALVQNKINVFAVNALSKLLEHYQISPPGSDGISVFEVPPPTPIGIPALQIDGIYYNMFPGCAGQLVFQTWYDEDICVDKDGNPLTRDNRGKPPDPAFSGNPPSGTDSNVPAPTYAPGGGYEDPTPGIDEPTENVENPFPPAGFPGTFYTITWRDYRTATGITRANPQLTIVGKYGTVVNRLFNNGGSVERYIMTGIDRPGNPAPIKVVLQESGIEPDGTPTVNIDSVAIVPQ